MANLSTPATRSEISGQRLEIDGVRFLCGLSAASSPDQFVICKNPEHIDRYRDLLAEFDRPTVVELGVAQGGSVAMLALLADPTMLIAIELDSRPLPALAAFIDRRHLSERVKVHLGVDQADQARLEQILDEAVGDGPIDIVVDDASHVYGPTRASFEMLFPRLAEGGVYLIEDWQCDHTMGDALNRILADPNHPQHEAVVEAQAVSLAPGAPLRRPLSRLAIELVLAMCSPTPVVEDVCFTENWIEVRRGSAPLGPGPMDLQELYTDPLGLLTP